MLRRRCDALARTMLYVAEACCGERWRAEVSSVFGSRHGPIGTTVELLEALASGRPVSPNGFTHSVHNTQLGLFSIWAGNTCAGSSVAGGPETFAHAFVEAVSLLRREPGRPALLVVGDEPIPAPLSTATKDPHGLWAVAFRLDEAGDGDALGFELAARSDRGSPPADEGSLPDGLRFLRWWLTDERELLLMRDRRVWRWTRLATPASSP